MSDERQVQAVSLRLALVTADRWVEAGLVSLFLGRDEFDVVARLSGGRELAEFLVSPVADVVLWDLGWASLPDIEDTTQQLEQIVRTGTPCICLVDDPDDALSLRLAGAAGVLSREADGDLILAAVPAVSAGLVVLDAAFSEAFWPARERSIEPLAEPLTAREMEVLQLLTDGLSNRAIGIRLQISEHTAKFHVTAIMAKLGAQSRTEAVVRATRLGLIYL